MKETLTYFRSFITDKDVASITPSSKYCIRKLSQFIDFSSTRILIEYGAGTGIFTKHFLHNLGPDARLFAFETNKIFFEKLQEIDDPRLHLFHESVENMMELLPPDVIGSADHIISGIPFSFFEWDMKLRILNNTLQALKPGGSFLAYQTPGHLSKPLNEVFGGFNSSFCWRNIPPYFIYEAIK